MEERKDPQKLLEEGNCIQFAPKGYSMYPFINPDKGDQVVVEPLSERSISKGDVVLYRRADEECGDVRLVLHRVQRVTKEGIFLVGDNQSNIEGPLQPAQMLGIMTARVRDGKELKSSNLFCKLFALLWLFVRPFRDLIKKPLAILKKFFQKQR